MAVVSSCHKTASVKSEEGEDDVTSSCPLCPGRHTCYNGRDKGSRSREGELIPKTRPQFGLQTVTRLYEAGIASNCRHTVVNSLSGLAHTARYTGEASHVRSSYLNRSKEGDAEGRVSDWSEVVTRTLNHMDTSMCPSAPDLEMRIIQGTLAWRTLPLRTGLLNQTSPQEDRWGNSGEIQCRSNFRFTRGIRAVWGDHYGSSLLENPYIPYQYMDSYLSSTGLGSASMEMEHLTTHLHRSRTMRSPQNE
ncbi:LOW QUALITY PROTEIN: hypothetical protein Cgig2_030333 [Carnegiea gigantea]|uniref:Uncharacterized protein ycf68 n=1 Tax=Carnegiea gigantea TaxID=171969 RepID=A0A9Q1JGS0_9CARY|nr:LOW QUALITY PROTEIN: hypothetical protein Cgig2_030333 [Carnegiea gigantea]